MRRWPASPFLRFLRRLPFFDIKGENPFKTRAYYNVAKTLSGIENLEEMVRENRLKEIKGVGDAIAAKIDEYIKTGAIAYYEDPQKEVPHTCLRSVAGSRPWPEKDKGPFRTN